MKPMGRKSSRFPCKQDWHPRKPYQNWWENMTTPFNNKTERQEVKRDLEKNYK